MVLQTTQILGWSTGVYKVFRKQVFVGLFLSLWISPQGYAEGLTLSDILAANFAANPALESSSLQVKMRQAEVEQIEGALDTRYNVSLGVSNEVAPTTSPFAATETNAAFVAGQVVQPLADGSSLTASLKYNRAELIYPSSVNPAFQSSPNPLYQHQIDLIYRYPLVAGSGNPSYNYQKEVAMAEAKAERLKRKLLKEQLAAQAIALYAQFVLNDLSVQLSEDAVLRAKQLLDDQKKRESFGLVEKEDRFQTEALLAARKLQLAQAVAARSEAQTALNRFMYQDSENTLSVKLASPQMQLAPIASLVKRAKQKRAVFEVLAAQYQAVEARLAMAQAAGDYQLDVVGQVGTRALDGKGSTAFVNGFNPVHDRYIGVSLEFSDVLGNKVNKAVVLKNKLAMESIQVEQAKASMDLETEIVKLIDALRNADIVLKAAKKQVRAEEKKYYAQVERYKTGRSPTSIVIQFEGDLRAAELRYLIQQVNKSVSEYQLALAMGELDALKEKSVDTSGDMQ